MKKLIICSLAVLLISGCSKTPEEKIEGLYQTGLEQINSFQYKTADSTFKKIFELDPASAPGLIGVSKVAEARLQYYDAINNYSMIIRTTTEYEDAFIGLYNSYKHLGFYHDALESAVHYNKLWHKNVHTKFILGEAYKNVGDPKRAGTFFNQAIKSEYEHKNAAQLMLASLLVQQGLQDDANKIATEAFANKTDDPIFYNAAAEYYETAGMIDSSMYYNIKLFGYDHSDINNVYISIKRALRNNYLADARMIINTLEDLKVEPILLEGLRLFYALHLDDKSKIRAHGQNYRAYDHKSLTGAMYEVLSRAEISDKLSMGQDLHLLEGDIAKGKFEPEFGEFYYYAMLMMNVKYEKNPQTVPQLEKLRGLRKNRKEYKLELALTNHVIGYFDECYKSLRVIESGHQLNAEWLTAIAEVWSNFAIRKYNTAEELYQKAIAADPSYLPAFESYLKLLTRISEYEKALKLYEKYPQFEKNNFTALGKTKLLFLNKKYKEGLEQFKLFYPSASGNIVFVTELFELLKSENRIDDMNSLLFMVKNSNADSKFLFAINAFDNNQFEKSLSYLEEAIAMEPRFEDATILKARVLYFSGSKTEAYDLFEDNLVSFRRNPLNLLYYSHILSLEGIDFPRAANLARQAAFEGYGTYKYIINLADIYYRMGRYDLCRGESHKAALILYETPYPFFRRGMACAKSDDQEKWGPVAIENLNKAIKLGLSGDNLNEANETLKSL